MWRRVRPDQIEDGGQTEKRSWFIDDSAVLTSSLSLPRPELGNTRKNVAQTAIMENSLTELPISISSARFIPNELKCYSKAPKRIKNSKTPVTRVQFYRAPFKHYWYLPFPTIIFMSASTALMY